MTFPYFLQWCPDHLPPEFSFEFAVFNSTHMPSSCCCLSTLSFLCISAFSSWYQFLSLPFAFLFSLIAAKFSSGICFSFATWCIQSRRFSGYFQQHCLGTFPETFWGYLILCSLQCHINLLVTSAADCTAFFFFLEFLMITLMFMSQATNSLCLIARWYSTPA